MGTGLTDGATAPPEVLDLRETRSNSHIPNVFPHRFPANSHVLEAIAFCATRNLGPSLAEVWEQRDLQVSVEMLEDLHLGPLKILPYQLGQGFQLASDPGSMYLGWWESSSTLDSLSLGP
jgi:hypothetical protein